AGAIQREVRALVVAQQAEAEEDDDCDHRKDDRGLLGRQDVNCRLQGRSGHLAPALVGSSLELRFFLRFMPKRALTNGGAAMNSTISDCTTETMSIGVPVVICMFTAPAWNAPKSKPAKKVPHGVERPSRATVIASKPSEPAMPAVSTFSVPATCATPAAPASAPARAIARMVVRATLMPAVCAASGLCPTARNSKPTVERLNIQEIRMTS